ncbi:MAG: ABC transporter substrate-binding protein [Proteobacteria bacterium]|nr:ABC transporter substrate-binding protein [Pseudomonadota bacterium]
MRGILQAFSILSLALALSGPARADTITIVADEWCPYNCAPDSGKPGIFIEIARYAFEKEGHTVDYRIIPWTRAIEDTREGRFTAITGASHGDASDFIFPDLPQSASLMSFYVKAGNAWQYTGMDSLAAVSLGSIDSYAYGEEIDKYIKANSEDMGKVQAIGGETALADNVSKLLKGRIDAVIESEDVMDYYLAQNGLTGKLVKAGHLPLTEDQSLFIAFSPKNPNAKKYAALLTDAMKTLQENGHLNAILKSYGLSHSTLQENNEAVTQPTAGQ